MPRQSSARRRRLAVACALLAVGCGRKSEEPKGEGTATPTPAAVLDAAPPPNPGLIYFAVSREGVVELKGGEFRRVISTQGRIDDLAIGARKEIYAIADAQILRVAADAAEDSAEIIGNRSAPGVARRIATAPDGTLWAISGKGLWRYDGTTWTVDETFPRPRTVVDIVATRGGRVVAAARDAAFILETDSWRPVELPDPPPEPKPATPPPAADDNDVVGDTGEDGVDEEGGSKRGTFVRSLALGSDDRVYASTSSGIYLLGDAEWKRVSPAEVGALAISGDGTLVAAADSGNILWADQEKELATLGIAAAELDAIATDELSRVWLATDGGLIVARRNGDPVAVYSAGSQAALPGRIVAIRVIESPTGGLLPKIAERRIGAVSGTVVGLDKKAVKDVTVEVCARPDTMFRGSPCAEAPYRGSVVTNADGHFRLENVPAGRYGVALKKGEEWIVDLTIDCCTQLFDGDEVTLKKIPLE